MVGLCVCTIKTTLSPYRSARTVKWMCDVCRKRARNLRLAKEAETKRRHTLLREVLPTFYCGPVEGRRPKSNSRVAVRTKGEKSK